MKQKSKLHFTVCLSGSGAKLKWLLSELKKKPESYAVDLVIADRECQGINRAIEHNIEFKILSPLTFEKNVFSRIPPQTDYLLLDECLSNLDSKTLKEFQDRIFELDETIFSKIKSGRH